MAKASAEFTNQLDEEFEEVKGGDYAPTHDFEVNDTITGVYRGSRVVQTKKGESTIHTFTVDGVDTDVWGSAILNSRLDEDFVGRRVRVIRRGKVTTKSGNQAWDYYVGVSKAALNRVGA
jgi:hypothetical protein